MKERNKAFQLGLRGKNKPLAPQLVIFYLMQFGIVRRIGRCNIVGGHGLPTSFQVNPTFNFTQHSQTYINKKNNAVYYLFLFSCSTLHILPQTITNVCLVDLLRLTTFYPQKKLRQIQYDSTEVTRWYQYILHIYTEYFKLTDCLNLSET